MLAILLWTKHISVTLMVLQVTYDPSVVSYEKLLDTFWGHIDPTQQNGQGGDQDT